MSHNRHKLLSHYIRYSIYLILGVIVNILLAGGGFIVWKKLLEISLNPDSNSSLFSMFFGGIFIAYNSIYTIGITLVLLFSICLACSGLKK